MKELKNREKWIRAVAAFLGTYGICYLWSLTGTPHASFSVMALPLLAVVYGLLAWTEKKLGEISEKRQRRRRCRYAAVTSLLFSLSMIMGYQLQTYGMTDGGVKGKTLILVRAVFLSIAVFPFGSLLFEGIEKAASWKPSAEKAAKWEPGKVYSISALVIFLCLIPVWLAYYPIIMSYDFHRQINEAVKGFAFFWPYQPIAHTWIIWVFLQLGYAVGNIQTGMAFFAIFQMLVYSLVAAYACTFLYRLVRRRWMAIAGVLFFGVFPYNSVMVLCTTKDVLFGTFFLLFVLLLAERFFFVRGEKQLVLDILIALTGCLMVQFRNNCLYAVAVFGVLWVIFAPRKEKLRVFLLCALLTAGGKVTGIVIKQAIGTQLGTAKVEMYSVPIQQFTRVGYYHRDSLDEETRQLLTTYVPEEYWQDYNPAISDSVKAMVGTTTFSSTWEGNLPQLFQDWFRLGLRFPNEYIDAFLQLTRGYWFPDDRSYAECLGYGMEGRMGTIYTYNSSAISDGEEITHESRFPWLEEQLEKIVSANAYYDWPVVSILFKSSFYFWGLFLVFAAFLYTEKEKQAVFCLFPLMYMGTMLLGPVVQLRYLFPAILTLPVFVCLLFLPREKEKSADIGGVIPFPGQ